MSASADEEDYESEPEPEPGPGPELGPEQVRGGRRSLQQEGRGGGRAGQRRAEPRRAAPAAPLRGHPRPRAHPSARTAPTVRGASEGGSEEVAVTGERAPFLQSGPLKTPLMPR